MLWFCSKLFYLAAIAMSVSAFQACKLTEYICVALQIDSVAEEVERCKSMDDMVSAYTTAII